MPGYYHLVRRLEAPARNQPGIDQQQRELESSISITVQSYTHVGPCDNGPGVTCAPKSESSALTAELHRRLRPARKVDTRYINLYICN